MSHNFVSFKLVQAHSRTTLSSNELEKKRFWFKVINTMSVVTPLSHSNMVYLIGLTSSTKNADMINSKANQEKLFLTFDIPVLDNTISKQ